MLTALIKCLVAIILNIRESILPYLQNSIASPVCHGDGVFPVIPVSKLAH